MVRSEGGVASLQALLASHACERAATCSSGSLGDKAGRFPRPPCFPCKEWGIWRRVNARRSSGPAMKVQLLSAAEPRPPQARGAYYSGAHLGALLQSLKQTAHRAPSQRRARSEAVSPGSLHGVPACGEQAFSHGGGGSSVCAVARLDEGPSLRTPWSPAPFRPRSLVLGQRRHSSRPHSSSPASRGRGS